MHTMQGKYYKACKKSSTEHARKILQNMQGHAKSAYIGKCMLKSGYGDIQAGATRTYYLVLGAAFSHRGLLAS
jgi:hypothetical protein